MSVLSGGGWAANSDTHVRFVQPNLAVQFSTRARFFHKAALFHKDALLHKAALAHRHGLFREADSSYKAGTLKAYQFNSSTTVVGRTMNETVRKIMSEGRDD